MKCQVYSNFHSSQVQQPNKETERGLKEYVSLRVYMHVSVLASMHAHVCKNNQNFLC